MNISMRIYIIVILMLILGKGMTCAQSERNLIRQGNRAYHQGKWVDAETQYRKALAKDNKNSQALYNLGCALMAQQKDSAALQQYNQAAQMETNPMRKAKSYHNMGTIFQNHREYAQAIEAYKMALRNNPHDDETRYNLALCKKLQKDQPRQNKNNDKNKNDKKQEQQKQQEKQDNNKDKEKDKDKNKQEKSDQEKMSKENAEQMLNAAIQEEKATKQKMQKAMSQPRKKALEKNW